MLLYLRALPYNIFCIYRIVNTNHPPFSKSCANESLNDQTKNKQKNNVNCTNICKRYFY